MYLLQTNQWMLKVFTIFCLGTKLNLEWNIANKPNFGRKKERKILDYIICV
jgi:hypothetical protein